MGSTASKWIYGYEQSSTGTPHIQGYIRFKNQTRFSQVKKYLPTAHWEKAKGTDDQNFKYCAKEGNYKTNFEPKLTREDMAEEVKTKRYKDVVWKPWQKSILDIVAGPTSPRKIYWIYEKIGNVGKTFLTTYLCLEKGTVLVQGKAQDIYMQTNNLIEAGVKPTLCLCDVPRVNLEYVSYQAIENLS